MDIHTTHQVRIYTNRQGHERITQVLAECSILYNAALEEWRTAYKQAGISRGLYDQMKELTLVRKDDAFWGGISVQVGRGVLRRLDRARNAFYRRVKSGATPGYPRFKSRYRWNTIEIAQPSRAMVKGKRIRIVGLPSFRIRKTRKLPDSEYMTSLSITKRGRRLFAQIGYKLPSVDIGGAGQESAEIRIMDDASFVMRSQPNASGDMQYKIVGIDMGISDRMALSNGKRIERRRKPTERLARAQRRLSACKKGSRRWRERKAILANHQYRERVANRNECHRLTTALVREYDLIAVEDLQIRNMTRSAKGTVEEPGKNVAAKSGLNRSILEQTWGLIQSQLAYKAEWAGREFVKVNPQYTSQACSRCNTVDIDNRQGKQYNCSRCGLMMDADTNAAINILQKGLARGNKGGLPSRAAVLDAAKM